VLRVTKGRGFAGAERVQVAREHARLSQTWQWHVEGPEAAQRPRTTQCRLRRGRSLCAAFSSLAEKVAITGCFLKKGMSLIVQSFAQLDPISYLKLGFLDQLILSRFQDKLGSNYRRLAKVLSFEKYFPLITIILLTQNLQWL